MITEVLTGFYNVIKAYPETWASTTTYALGDFVKASTYNSHTYLVTTAGTTGEDEPTWPTTNDETISSGATTFTTKDTKCYNTMAPQTDEVPYVSWGLLTESPIGDFEDFEAVEDLTFWVNCYSSKSIADIAEIADEVMTVMDGATLTVVGYTNMKCVREFIGQPSPDIETGIFQIPLRYRVWLDKT